MMSIAKLFVCALAAVAVNANDQASQPKGTTLTGDNALELAQTFARALTKDPSFKLGKEFRNSDGSLRKAKLLTKTGQLHANRNANVGKPEPIPKDKCGDEDKEAGSFTYQLKTTGGMTGASLCLWFDVDAGTQAMNYDMDKKSAVNPKIEWEGLTGVECDECWAYTGAKMQMYLDCDLGLTSQTCKFITSVGGGIGFNFDFEVKDPKFEKSSTLSIVPEPKGAPDNIADDDYKPAVKDPSTGLFVSTALQLSMTVDAKASLTGTASMKAGFETAANFLASADSSATPIVDAAFDAKVSLDPPEYKQDLKLTDKDEISLKVAIDPTVYWRVGIEDPTGTASAYVVFTTPLHGEFSISQSAPSTSFLTAGNEVVCKDHRELDSKFHMTGVTVHFVKDFSIPLEGDMDIPLDESDDSFNPPTPVCIYNPSDPPTPAGDKTKAPTPGGAKTKAPTPGAPTPAGNTKAPTAGKKPTPEPTEAPPTPTGSPTNASAAGGGGGGSKEDETDGWMVLSIILMVVIVAMFLAFAFRHKLPCAAQDDDYNLQQPLRD